MSGDLERLEYLIYKGSKRTMRPHATRRYASTILDSNWLEQVKAEAARDALIEASEQLPDFPGAGYAHYTRAWLFSRGQDQVTPPIGGEAS